MAAQSNSLRSGIAPPYDYPEAQTLRPVGLAALDRLDESAQRLATLSDALEESLSRVLTAQPPTTTGATQGNAASQNSHVTDRINRVAFALEMMADRIDSIRKRVEL